MFRRTNSKRIYQDPWVSFYQDAIEFDDGTAGTYGWVQRMNGVGVVVVNDQQQILMHKEYRYVIDTYSWEFQGGGIDDDETPEQAAVRELAEETGIQVTENDLVPLGSMYPLHSFNTELVTLFLVQVQSGIDIKPEVEAGETIVQYAWKAFDEALAMIDDGRVNDAMTSHAVQMVVRRIRDQSHTRSVI